MKKFIIVLVVAVGLSLLYRSVFVRIPKCRDVQGAEVKRCWQEGKLLEITDE